MVLNVCEASEGGWSKLQAFHSQMNKLRKERPILVVMVCDASAASPGDTSALRRYLSESYMLVLSTYLIKRRGLDPRQAAALLLKRSNKMCEPSEEAIVYCEKWKDLSYPSLGQLPLAPSLVSPTPAAVASSEARLSAAAAAPPLLTVVPAKTTVDAASVVEERKFESSSGKAPQLGPRRATPQARVSVNDFAGSIPEEEPSFGKTTAGAAETRGSAAPPLSSVPSSVAGSGVQRGSGVAEPSPNEPASIVAAPVAVTASASSKTELRNSGGHSPDVPPSSPGRSSSGELDRKPLSGDSLALSTSGERNDSSPRAEGKTGVSRGHIKPHRGHSTGFLARLGAKLTGRKGPKADIPDGGSGEDKGETSPPPSRPDKQPERLPQVEKLAEEQDRRSGSFSASSGKREIVDIVLFSDLGPDDLKLVSEANLESGDCEANLFVLLNVLHFHTKKVYRLRNIQTGELRITSSEREDDVFDYAKAEIELLSKEDPQKVYKLGREVGTGGFGSVYEAIPLKNKKALVACKVLPHSKPKDKKYNLQEVLFLKKYPHENIVTFQQAFKVNTKSGAEMWMIMELMRGGTLTEAVKSHCFKEDQIAYVCQEMLFGIRHLHRNNLAHRDLKSANVMLTIDGQVKLIDFGLCCDMSEGEQEHMLGSPFWIPPEMVRREPHGMAADVWSFGICTLEVRERLPLFLFPLIYLNLTLFFSQPACQQCDPESPELNLRNVYQHGQGISQVLCPRHFLLFSLSRVYRRSTQH